MYNASYTTLQYPGVSYRAYSRMTKNARALSRSKRVPRAIYSISNNNVFTFNLFLQKIRFTKNLISKRCQNSNFLVIRSPKFYFVPDCEN